MLIEKELDDSMEQQQSVIYEIVETLEENLQFWRTGPTDNRRHFVGPEVLHALAWAATSLVLPIFLSATNEIVKDNLKAILHKSESNDLQSKQESATELAAALDNANVKLSEGQLQSSVQAVSEYLSSRGWPKALAANDAKRIVAILKRRVERKK